MLTLFLTLAAAASDPASAAMSSTVTESVVIADEAPTKPKKICKPMANLTGSRIAKTVCKTKEQWEQRESASELTVKGHAGNPSPQCALCTQSPGPN